MQLFKSILFAIFLLLPFLASSQEKQLQERVKQLITPEIDAGKVAGAIVGVAKGNEILLYQAYGYADLDKKMALKKNASFPIASISKQFVAVGILQLAEAGKLSLDKDIRSYLDYETGNHRISIRQLLNHTSGIKNYTKQFKAEQLAGFSKDSLLSLMEVQELDFEPGTAMQYSNTGYFMLAMIIEKVSGQSFEAYMQQHIFRPLGMENSLQLNNNASHLSNLPEGYHLLQDSLMHQPALQLRWAFGAGSLVSTMEDQLKYMNSLHRKKTLLSAENYDKLIQPGELKDGYTLPYGLGIQNTTYMGNTMYGHSGNMAGYLSFSGYFPEEELSIVVFVNTSGSLRPREIAFQLAENFISNKEKELAFRGQPEQFSGTYRGVIYGNTIARTIKEKNRQLFVELGGQLQPLTYQGDNTWKDEDGYRYTFSEDKVMISAALLSMPFYKE